MSSEKSKVILSTCKDAFEFEEKRTSKLDTKTEKVLASVAILTGLNLVNPATISSGIISPILSYVGLLFLLLSLLFTLINYFVKGYVGYPRGTQLFDNLTDQNITEEKVNAEISLLFLEAKEQNAKINDKRANQLNISTILLVAAFITLSINYFITF